MDPEQKTAVRIGPNEVIRFILELFAFVSLGIWGFVSWAFPLDLVFGILAPAFAIVIWALFLSPRAVLRIDAFGRALIEILIMGAAAIAWLTMGQWIVAIVFGVVATASGVISGRRRLGAP